MNAPLPLPLTEPISPRLKAMFDALVAQRNATADEVVNLCGDLAEAREEIRLLKEERDAGRPA